MIISFAHTTPALLAGRKTVTRREWTPEYGARVQQRASKDRIFDAYDRSPRIHGKRVAVIRVTSITYEPMSRMPLSDYEGEGFAYLYEHPEYLPKKLWGMAVGREDFSPAAFARWRSRDVSMWVVRFELGRVLL